jgi:hypothetical protein
MSVHYDGMAIRIVQTSRGKIDGKSASCKSVVWWMEWDTENMPAKLVHPALLEMDAIRNNNADMVREYPDEFKLATDSDKEHGRFTMVTLNNGNRAYYRTDRRGMFVPRTYGRKAYLQEFVSNNIARYIARYGMREMGIDYSAADVARLQVRVEVCCGVDVTAVGTKRHMH